jgi:hypothetical protein
VSTRTPARRVRGRFISFGFWTSVATFVVIEGDAILDQSEIGHASPLFMFGTSCLAAAACIALFAIITAIGLAVSAAFKEQNVLVHCGRLSLAGDNKSVLIDSFDLGRDGIPVDQSARPYSITLSARAVAGTSRPRVWAVVRLITDSVPPI